MIPRSSHGIPLVPLVTFVLASILLVLVGGLFFVVDRILEDQVRQSLALETQVWADSLAASSAKVLWNFDEGAVQALGEDAAKNPLVLSLQILNDRNQILFRSVKQGSPLNTVRIPVLFEGTAAGSIELTSSAALVHTRVLALEIPASLAGGVFLLLVVFVTPLVLTRTVLKPILRLGHLVETVDPVILPDGALAMGSRIREVRALEKALGRMAQAVRENVHTLEDRVEERTSALNLARAQLAHAEALATLGQLTSGIAHELNTPLAAILSANHTLQSDVNDELLCLLASPWDRSLVEDPLGFLKDVSNRARVLDTHRASAIRNELKALWTGAGRDPNSELVELLSTKALFPIGKTLADLPWGTIEESTLRVVILLARLEGIIDIAAEKGAAVVQALRGHLKHEKSEPSVWFDAATSLEQCLLLQKDQLGNGVEVRRRYDADLKLFGPGTRLGQVWLNLINNALQSIGRKGWIEVSAVSDGAWAEVRIGDSGPLVPAELRARLFEPYFTTKSTGLGLGLNLSRAIVEAVGGSLDYEDSHGKKAFVVRWPQPTQG